MAPQLPPTLLYTGRNLSLHNKKTARLSSFLHSAGRFCFLLFMPAIFIGNGGAYVIDGYGEEQDPQRMPQAEMEAAYKKQDQHHCRIAKDEQIFLFTRKNERVKNRNGQNTEPGAFPKAAVDNAERHHGKNCDERICVKQPRAFFLCRPFMLVFFRIGFCLCFFRHRRLRACICRRLHGRICRICLFRLAAVQYLIHRKAVKL